MWIDLTVLAWIIVFLGVWPLAWWFFGLWKVVLFGDHIAPDVIAPLPRDTCQSSPSPPDSKRAF